MQVLKVICGIAVILVSLHLVHAIHHFVAVAVNNGPNAAIWSGAAFAALIGIFSFIGGVLLLMRK